MIGRTPLKPFSLLALLLAATGALAQSSAIVTLPDAPSPVLVAASASAQTQAATPPAPQTAPQPAPQVDRDADGNAVPLEHQQPKRILGFMPNFRSVSTGVTPHPLGWGYNFRVATRQAFDYSSFLFLGLTSLSAKGMDEHPTLGKGASGFYAYSWRGFLDKTDNTYLSAFAVPSLLHEDTRFYALGSPHHIATRALYVISRQAVARTYSGRDTPNIAGLGGKVLTQYISTFYYPDSSEDFGVLATKFGYSVMRDVIFTSIREFYPDIAAHYIRKHRAKLLAQQQQQMPATPAPEP